MDGVRGWSPRRSNKSMHTADTAAGEAGLPAERLSLEAQQGREETVTRVLRADLQ